MAGSTRKPKHSKEPVSAEVFREQIPRQFANSDTAKLLGDQL